ncbi:MAG: type II secretion system protein [Planctomycetes bacterium]|nr:type II secretion system protein [Planctomycetota bacterium]
MKAKPLHPVNSTHKLAPTHKALKFTSQYFSLIELIIVITIMSILAALILPSLRRMHDNARRISCMVNLDTIYDGHVMFSDDYDGLFWATRGYGYTTYGNNDDTVGYNYEKVEGQPDGQFFHERGFLEPYIGEKGLSVHFCPDYNRPADDQYIAKHLQVLNRGTYTSLRHRASVGLNKESFTGPLFRMSDYRVTSAYARKANTKEFIEYKPHITYDGYKSQEGGLFQEAHFPYLPFVMDYIPRKSSWGAGFNAGNGQAFYQEKSMVHDGFDLPILYTDGHFKPRFYFPYLLEQASALSFDESLITYLVEDLLQQ